jgi:hypothetical protein
MFEIRKCMTGSSMSRASRLLNILHNVRFKAKIRTFRGPSCFECAGGEAVQAAEAYTMERGNINNSKLEMGKLS